MVNKGSDYKVFCGIVTFDFLEIKKKITPHKSLIRLSGFFFRKLEFVES